MFARKVARGRLPVPIAVQALRARWRVFGWLVIVPFGLAVVCLVVGSGDLGLVAFGLSSGAWLVAHYTLLRCPQCNAALEYGRYWSSLRFPRRCRLCGLPFEKWA